MKQPDIQTTPDLSFFHILPLNISQSYTQIDPDSGQRHENSFSARDALQILSPRESISHSHKQKMPTVLDVNI